MKKVMLAFAFLASVPLAAAADVSKEDIKKLVAAGISEDVILTYIRTHGPVAKLTSDDMVELKQAGASQKILNAVAGDSTPAAAPAQKVVERVVEKKVYVPRTTYVYDRSPVYYSSYPTYSYGVYSSYYNYCSPYYRSYSYSYPRYRSYSYPRYYGSRYGYCGPRVGFSVGWGR